MVIHQSQWSTVDQPDALTNNEVNKVADGSNVLWVPPLLTDVPMGRTLLRSRK